MSQPQHILTDGESEQPRWHPRRKLWIPVVALVVLFRMFLVGDEGMVMLRYDSTQYAEMVAQYLSNDSLATLPTHRPGLAMLAWLVTQFGIPYKLFLDAMITLAAVFAGITIGRVSRSQLTGLAAFTTILLNPWFMVHSQNFMTEALTGLLLLLLLLLAIPMIRRPIDGWPVTPVILAAVVSSIYVLARNETLLLAFFWASILLVVLIRRGNPFRRQFFARSGNWKLALIAIPFVTALGATEMLRAWHQSRFGVRSVCVTEAVGINVLIDALYSVPPEEAIRFAPVTRESISRACDESPILGQHRDELLDVDRDAYYSASDRLGLKDEFGTWLNWHLVDCFGGLTAETNREMLDAAKEIRRAQADGRLERRMAMYPIDPLWQKWLPDLPGQFLFAFWRSTVRQSTFMVRQYDRLRIANSVEQGFFDDALLRRRGVGSDRSVRVFGKSSSDRSRIAAAQIVVPPEEVLITIPILPSVDGMKKFSISLDDIENRSVDESLMIRLVADVGDRQILSKPKRLDESLREWVSFEFPGPEKIEAEWWRISATRYQRDGSFRGKIRGRYEWHWFLVGASLILAFITGWRHTGDRNAVADMASIAAVGIGFVLARCFFYSLIEVWLQWSITRYVDPNVLISTLSLLCLSFVVGASVGQIRRRPAAHD